MDPNVTDQPVSVERSKAHQIETIRYTQTRVVPIDPDLLRERRIIMGLYNDPRADTFRILRSNLLKQLRDNGWNSFAVTSATPGAGKTFVSINLAIAIAMEANQSVLLVDADLRRPLVANYLGLPAGQGLADYLEGDVSLESILVNPGIERLVVLPGRDSRENASELVSSPQMVNLVRQIKTRYKSRVILFDIPPLFVADDALSLLSQIDGVVLVVEDEVNTPDEIQDSMHLLEQSNLLGLVLNKSRQMHTRRQMHYGY